MLVTVLDSVLYKPQQPIIRQSNNYNLYLDKFPVLIQTIYILGIGLKTLNWITNKKCLGWAVVDKSVH